MTKKTDEVWQQDFRKTQEYIKKEWVDTGFITVHQWKNFIDYLNIFVEKQFQKKIKDTLKGLNQTNRKGWSDDTPKDFIDGWNSCIEALKQILKGD